MRSTRACILLSRLMAGKRTCSSYDLPQRSRLHENVFFSCLKLCCHPYITGSYASLSMETKMGNTDIYQFTKQLSNIFFFVHKAVSWLHAAMQVLKRQNSSLLQEERQGCEYLLHQNVHAPTSR